MVLVMVLVVLGVIFRTGKSSGKPLLLPVQEKTPPRTTKTTTGTILVMHKILPHLFLEASSN